MFRRKKEDGDEMKPETVPTTVEDDSLPEAPKSLLRPTPPTLGASPAVPSFQPKPAAPMMGRGAPSWAARERAPSQGGADSGAESKKLIVGRDIVLSGQITSCERLIVEGRVEASLTDSRLVELAETGHFKGSAEIETADIAGRFEGTLTVRERLFIRSTGKVDGKITYGQIEIEPGGEISGEVHVGPRRPSAAD